MPRVLVVDDDHTFAQTLADMISLLGHDPEIVHSPRHAIESIEREAPALILLDLNMPGVDGLEVCRYIKRDPAADKTKVIFVTAEDDPTMKDAAKRAGASGFLVKPVDIDTLELVLDRTIAVN